MPATTVTNSIQFALPEEDEVCIRAIPEVNNAEDRNILYASNANEETEKQTKNDILR